jgi:PAS domain S-box-containing protein
VLTSGAAVDSTGRKLVDVFGLAGNVTLLERPLGSATLVSAARVALRARQRQYEVRELVEQRETVLTGISDAFSSIGHDWRYLYVNDRVAEMAGLRKSEMLGRNIWEIFPQAVGTEFYKLAHQAMEERRAVQGEIFHPPWGRWLDTRIYPTKEGIVVFRADVTERKQQEALAREQELRLKENEALLRLAIEAADAGTFDYYPQTGALRLSDRCKELLGVSGKTEVRYEDYLNAIHPDDRHIVNDTVEAVLRPGSAGRYDIEYRTSLCRDGAERWLAEKGRAVVDESGRATRFIGTILDVTERKNAEITLQRAKHDAEAANRAKDQFLAMLSHELRTPLTPVLMTIASLRRQPDLTDELHHDLEVLAAERGARGIADRRSARSDAHRPRQARAAQRRGRYSQVTRARAQHLELRPAGETAHDRARLPRRGASLLGRRGAPPAGVLEPGKKCGEVHAARRPAGDPHPERLRAPHHRRDLG